MPQLALNLDDAILAQVEKAAAQRHTSIYSWVEQSIKKNLPKDYSADYSPEFFALCGALKDVPFELPTQGKFEDDAPREVT